MATNQSTTEICMPKKNTKKRFAALEPTRLAFLEKRLSDSLKAMPALRKLRDMLLAVDGLALVPPLRDPDLDAILVNGRVFDGASARVVPGEPSDCHRNVVLLWATRPEKRQVATGYALSPDGLWRCHSWVMEGKQVLEATEKRLLYFGVALSIGQLEPFIGGGAWSAPIRESAPQEVAR
jgi:hypothetical protein